MSNQVARSSKGLYASRNSNDYIMSGAQTLANTVAAAVLFDTIVTSDRLDDKVTYAAGVFTVQKAGVFCLSTNIDFTANATGVRQIYYLISGDAKGTVCVNTAATGSTCVSSSWTQYLPVGATISVLAYQGSGGNLDVTVLSRLAITYI